MIKILTIIGARPQIIKAAAISRSIRDSFSSEIKEIMLHTGQHYDANMSDVFFSELEIPAPDLNLNVGSKSHAQQTAEMLTGIEKAIDIHKPHCMLVYGDTNSTLSGALVASKLHLPCLHIEAGLRSFNKQMPEEINRIVCDHLSTMLFCPTQSAIQNLINEGFEHKTHPPYSADSPGIFLSGDIMFDNSVFFKQKADIQSSIMDDLGVKTNEFILCTIHRDHNTDHTENFENIFNALLQLIQTENINVVLPLHPRAKSRLQSNLSSSLLKKIKNEKKLIIIDPVSYIDMVALESNCRLVMSDSGGVQKEAYFFKKPCVVLRPETEWTELIENGNNQLAGADPERIIKAFNSLYYKTDYTYPEYYGNGDAAGFICKTIIQADFV